MSEPGSIHSNKELSYSNNVDIGQNPNLSLSNLTPYVFKNGSKISLQGNDLSTKEGKDLIQNLVEKYQGTTTELDISNCNLNEFPEIILKFKRLTSFDLRGNPFKSFEKVVQFITNFNNS